MSNNIYDPLESVLNIMPASIEISYNLEEYITEPCVNHNGIYNPFYGKRHTQASRELMTYTRVTRGCFKGEKNPMFGKANKAFLGRKHSKDTKIKMSESAKKRGSNRTGASHTEEQKQNNIHIQFHPP